MRDKTKKATTQKKWYGRNKAAQKAYQKKWRTENLARFKSIQKTYYETNLERERARRRRYYLRCKRRLMTMYGGSCAACGNDSLICLQIDHINNDGAQERRSVGIQGTGYYHILLKSPRRADLQILCANCQVIKRYFKSSSSTGDMLLDAMKTSEEITNDSKPTAD